MQLRLLGPLELVGPDGAIKLGAAKERALLAALAIHVDESISEDHLADALWGDAPPANVTKTLATYVSRLRRVLAANDGLAIETTPGGYRLRADAGVLDVSVVESLLRQARELTASGDAAGAAMKLADALASFHGQPLSEFVALPWARAEAARLADLRFVVLEERITADLGRGRHHELVGELEARCAESPLREHLWALRMIALYRSGRQADALRVCGELRSVLRDELGVDPGPEIRALEQSILDQDPALDWAAGLGAPTAAEDPRVTEGTDRPERSRAHNLPVERTRLVGRTTELADVTELVRSSGLVTLVGSGGAGKTRLAVHVGVNVVDEFPAGVWFVDLAPVVDQNLVGTAIARALMLPDEASRSTIETIQHHLLDSTALIILDNCEHVVAACAETSDAILQHCPLVRILATSREPLGVGGEVTWRVPSLELAREGAGVDEIREADAVQLFVERAARSQPGFAIDDENARAVAEICRRVDGIPLAIELAAARTQVLSPDQIETGLADRFRLLTGGARTAVPRQQTLRASVDWSHDLLTEPERVLFRRLAVFLGSFEYDAAAAVGSGTDGFDSADTLDLLTQLVGKSLVSTEPSGQVVRYRMLETVRHYALDRLVDAGEAELVREAHREHYLAFAETAARGVRSPDQDRWLDALNREMDNLRAAYEWSVARDDLELALRLAMALGHFWLWGGRFGEGAAWLDAVLDAAVDVPPEIRVRALALRSRVEGAAFGSSLGWGEEAIALAREQRDDALLTEALAAMAFTTAYWGGLAEAWSHEAVELARGTGDHWNLCDALCTTGIGHVLAGRPVPARAALEESRTIAQEQGHKVVARLGGVLLSFALLMQGELAEAHALADTSALAADRGHDRTSAMTARVPKAWALALLGDAESAHATADESIAMAQASGLSLLEGLPRMVLGINALVSGDAPGAIRESSEAWVLSGGLIGMTDVALITWADAELASGDVRAARQRIGEAIEHTGTSPDSWFHAWALTVAARVTAAEGATREAAAQARVALSIRHELGDVPGVAEVLELLALLAGREGHHLDAARLLGAAGARRKESGAIRFESQRDAHDAVIAAGRAAVGSERFEATLAVGTARSLADAVADAHRTFGERQEGGP